MTRREMRRAVSCTYYMLTEGRCPGITLAVRKRDDRNYKILQVDI